VSNLHPTKGILVTKYLFLKQKKGNIVIFRKKGKFPMIRTVGITGITGKRADERFRKAKLLPS